MQGKDEAPPGLDMRAQQQRRSPHGGGGGASFNSNKASAGSSTTLNDRAGRQRIFQGSPPRHNSTFQEDSDSISMSSDDEDLSVQEGDYHNANSSSPAAATNGRSETQTLHNSSSSGPRNSEPRATIRGQQHDAESSRMPGFSFQTNNNPPPTTPSAKRKRPVFQDDSDDEFGGADLADPDTERQLATIADESARKQRQLQTQGLARSLMQQPQLVGAGAGIEFEHNGGLPTPRTNRNSLRIADEERELRSIKRQRTVQEVDQKDGGGGIIGDIATPTPYRKTDALALPSEPQTPSSRFAQSINHQREAAALSPQPPTGDANSLSTPGTISKPSDYPKIKDEVMAILNVQPISEATRHSIQKVLTQHERRVQGLIRGRDATRAKLQARDAQVAALQARVAHLENGRKVDQGNLKKLREASELLMTLSQQDEEVAPGELVA